MSDPYVGEIRMFGGNFAPLGWAFCDGQLLAIAENDVLFTLIGTTYGGDGQQTFGLPDLRGRVPIHQGQGQGLSNRTIGENGGAEDVTLVTNQLPSHSHIPNAATAGNSPGPAGGIWANSNTGDTPYNDSANVNMNAGLLSRVGGNQPHTNIQPHLGINFIISLFGIYPSPS